jgi:hypothetical protein
MFYIVVKSRLRLQTDGVVGFLKDSVTSSWVGASVPCPRFGIHIAYVTSDDYAIFPT